MDVQNIHRKTHKGDPEMGKLSSQKVCTVSRKRNAEPGPTNIPRILAGCSEDLHMKQKNKNTREREVFSFYSKKSTIQ